METMDRMVTPSKASMYLVSHIIRAIASAEFHNHSHLQIRMFIRFLSSYAQLKYPYQISEPRHTPNLKTVPFIRTTPPSSLNASDN
ncbi:hypothetical protein C8R48DRAFT_277791 [Suillus tomentosus]|nr:hypothetical protein C8R48DRAFT_277791 [Suillus tomentosus]